MPKTLQTMIPFAQELSQNFGTKVLQLQTLTTPIRRLQEIDWDFRDANTSYLTHGLHPYPAKFIPQIPNMLVQELSTEGNTVADIFCGSGTTLVEGLLLKRNVVGIDANPLACLISAGKTARLKKGDKESLIAIANRALELAREIRTDENPTLFPAAKFVSKAPKPIHNAIQFWFEPFVVEELAEILFWCRGLQAEHCQNVALTSFSAIIVTVSRQDSDTRYVRRTKKIRPGDTLRRFAQLLTENAEAVDSFSKLVAPNLSSQVIHSDILKAPDVPSLDLVVCSPPYPNAYSYHLYHMTRMVWLGMNQPEFKRQEIGSHRKFSNKGRGGATIETFKCQMREVFSWLRTALRDRGHACFVVGNSIIHGKTYDNAEVLKEAARSEGFSEVIQLGRNIKDTSKAFNPRIGKIRTERIIIFQNRGARYQ